MVINSVVRGLTLAYLFVYGSRRITGATILRYIQSVRFPAENYGIHGNASCLQDSRLRGSPTSRVMSSALINRRYIGILRLKGRTYGGETWYIYSIGVPHRFGKKRNKTAKQPPSNKIARNEKLQIAPLGWFLQVRSHICK